MLICVVIPHYDHLDQFRKSLPSLIEHELPLVVVDDNSPKEVFDALARLLDEDAPGSTLIRHSGNLGKGGAVMTGLKAALEAGFTHALQVDADGQHDLEGITQLIAETTRQPKSIICGMPNGKGRRIFGSTTALLIQMLRKLTPARTSKRAGYFIGRKIKF